MAFSYRRFLVNLLIPKDADDQRPLEDDKAIPLVLVSVLRAVPSIPKSNQVAVCVVGSIE